MNISKKQKMNSTIARLVQEWLYSLLPEDQIKLLTPEKIQQLMPQEPYFFSQGQIRVNAYTLKWFRKKIKKVLRKTNKDFKEISLNEIMNA
tara:strand:- start:1669 stop:1941 length:273 start_codon:yes stop_codon:yes gene_type:complete